MSNVNEQAQKYQLKLQQDRARARKYYAANKAKVAEHRKQDRIAIKALKLAAKQEPVPAPAPTVIPLLENLAKPVEEGQKKLVLELSEETVVKFLEEKFPPKSANLIAYRNNAKAIFFVTGCDNMQGCLKKPNEIVKEIETGKKKKIAKGTPDTYSTNSKKGMYQTIVYLLDHLTGLYEQIPKKIQQIYRDKFEYYKRLSTEEGDERNKTAVAIDWDEYIKAILIHFRKPSKEYLVASIYREMPVRDDLQLKIVTTKEDATDENTNYVIIPKDVKEECEAINNVYKTSKKYGSAEYKFSPEVSKLIRNYVKKNKLKPTHYLFPEKSLSAFVSKMGAEVGYKVTINTTRKMTSTLAKDLPLIERIEASKKMGHSEETARRVYRINKKEGEVVL